MNEEKMRVNYHVRDVTAFSILLPHFLIDTLCLLILRTRIHNFFLASLETSSTTQYVPCREGDKDTPETGSPAVPLSTGVELDCPILT